MKCGVVFVCLLAGFVCGGDGFKLLTKIKDFIRPTTSTTTERTVPIVPDFGLDNKDSSESSESSEHNDWSVKSTTQRSREEISVDGLNTNDNFDNASSLIDSYFENSSRRFGLNDFPTVAPQIYTDSHPGPVRDNTITTSTTNKYNEEKFVKFTTERMREVSNSYDSTNSNSDITSSTNNSVFEDTSRKFVKKEDLPTISPPLGGYPGGIRLINTTQSTFYESNKNQDQSTTQVNTLYSDGEFEKGDTFEDAIGVPIGSYPGGIRQTSTTQSTFYEPNKNQGESTTQVNRPTYSEGDTFEDAVDCGANPNGDDSHTNELKPGQQTSSRGCANENSKPGDIPNSNSGDQESTIVFPDNPALKPTQEPKRIYDRYEPRSSTTSRISKDEGFPTTTARSSQDESASSTTVRTKKAHVPVAVDDGRRILDAPTKDCGPGKKADESGRCRPVV